MSNKKELPIKYVDYGLANRFDDCIEIHKDLQLYPEIHSAIITHELEHTDESFSWKDFMHDFRRNPDMPYFKLMVFMLKRPSTWTQYLPIYYNKHRGIVYDVNHILIYVFIGLVLFGCWRLIPFIM